MSPSAAPLRAQRANTVPATGTTSLGVDLDRTPIAIDPSWESRALPALRWLSESPGLLFAALFLLSAGANFYAGIVHDASVYSLQALNAATDGAYSTDLFLKYGSQDRFSIFSLLVGPAISLFGIDTSFFVLYLASHALWLWASIRFVRTLLKDPALSAIAALFVAVAPMWFGGLNVFHVAEPFFTPRLPACAAALLSLEQLLRNRPSKALFLAATGMLLHPVMAFPAMAVALAWLGVTRFRRWGFVGLLVIAIGVASVVLVGGARLGLPLASIDDGWRDVIRRAAPYNFPAEWEGLDWLRVVGGLLIVSISAMLMRRDHPGTSRFLAVIALVASFGLLFTTFAASGSIALIFQAQPYRALWLIAFLEGPLGIWLVQRWYATKTVPSQLAAVLIVCYLAQGALFPVQLAIILIVCAVVLLARLAITNIHFEEILRQQFLSAAVIGVVCSAIALPLLVGVLGWHSLIDFDPLTAAKVLAVIPGPIAWLLLGTAIVVWLHRQEKSWHRLPLLLTIGGLAVQSVAFALPVIEPYRSKFDPEAANNEFARTYISEHRKVDRLLTVYTNFAAAQTIWVDWGAKSYFHLTQVIGVMFSRDNAAEALRRAELVRPFELQHFRSEPEMGGVPKLMVERLFGDADKHPPASEADVRLLCSDAELDIVMIEGPLLLRPAASNGSIQIYDCQQLRAAMALRH